jgi:hypothetical protein
MARLFEIRLPLERAYTREAMLALELLDSVTLERVTQGVEVTAKGLTGRPILNHGGLFVWLKEDVAKLEKLLIEPGVAPFERVEIAAAQVARPLHRVQLKPLVSYPFAPGITAIRGRLVEKDNMPRAAPRVAIAGATIRLEWLDDDGVTWHPWLAPAVTNAVGDFTAMVRLARGRLHEDGTPPRPDDPRLDADGNMSVRLFAKRANGVQKQKVVRFPQGRVADKTYAWDDLQ